jgi:hypothetical protein
MIATAEPMVECEGASAEETIVTREPGADSCDGRSAAVKPLEQAVLRRIAQRTWGRLRQLHIEVDSKLVLVRGSSPNYYLKQLALAAVQEVFPALPVQHDIQVARSESARLPGWTL